MPLNVLLKGTQSALVLWSQRWSPEPLILGTIPLPGHGQGRSGGGQGHRHVAVHPRVFKVQLADPARIGLELLQPPDDLFESLYTFRPIDHRTPPARAAPQGQEYPRDGARNRLYGEGSPVTSRPWSV